MLRQLLLAQASLLALGVALPAFAQDATVEEPAAVADAAADAASEAADAAGDAADAAADSAAEAADAAAQAVSDAADAAASSVGEATGAAEAAVADATAPTEPMTRDTVVATVNGTEITLGEVIVAASQLPQQYQQLPADILFSGVTDQLVQQELLAQTVTEVPKRVEIALANQRRSLVAGEVVAGVMEEAATDEAVQAAYDATYANATPVPEWNASHILVATEEEAKAVEERIKAGEDFAAIAKELSTDTGSGAQGGELGWFSAGQMVPEFETGVAALAAGAVSAPIESQFGWHVIKLNETRDKPAPTLDEVRGEIEGQVRDAAVQARLAELTAAGTVVQPEPGQFDPAVLSDLSLLDD